MGRRRAPRVCVQEGITTTAILYEVRTAAGAPEPLFQGIDDADPRAKSLMIASISGLPVQL